MGNLEIVKEKSKHYLEDVDDSHGWFHSLRVLNLAKHIAEEEGGKLEVIRVSAYLHDIARGKEKRGETNCHAEEAAEMCVPILKEAGYNQSFIEKVQHCIKTHRYSNNHEPDTLEAKIFEDADRLEALGATTIARCFSDGGSRGRPIHDPSIEPQDEYTSAPETSINLFREKTINIEPENFNTETAQEIAKGRYEFVRQFLDRFLAEWKGEK